MLTRRHLPRASTFTAGLAASAISAPACKVEATMTALGERVPSRSAEPGR